MDKPQSDNERPVYTVKETAGKLTLSLNTTYELIRRGELPHVRLGRRIVIPRKALEALLSDTEELA